MNEHNIIMGVDGWIYVEKSFFSPTQLAKIKMDLLIEKWNVKNRYIRYINLYSDNGRYVKLPRNYAIRSSKIPSKINLSSGKPLTGHQESSVNLRDYQNAAVDALLKSYNSPTYGGIVQMITGSGKTYVALKFALKLSKKTLIVVQTKSEIVQWRLAIKKFCNETVKKLTHNFDGNFAITTIRSLMKNKGKFKFKFKLFKQFGLVILDEVHVTVTKQTLSIFKNISRRYILGMTATPDRLDRMHIMYDYYIGSIVYKYMKKNTINPTIYMYPYKSPEPQKYCIVKKNKNDNIDYVRMVNLIQTDPTRLKIIIKIIKKCHADPDTQKILVVSKRRSTLDVMYEHFKDNMNCGVYYSMKESDQKKILTSSRVIFAIYNLAKQSLNVEDCNCMILLSCPIMHRDRSGKYNYTGLDQIIGRVMRKPWKIPPKIIIINDMWSIFKRHATLQRHYFRHIKKIPVITMNDNIQF